MFPFDMDIIHHDASTNHASRSTDPAHAPRLRRVRALAFVALLAGICGPVFAAEPAALYGRWATDPTDCADNRFVWTFAEDRAALVVNNAPLGGWRKPEYRSASEVVTVSFAGPPRREIDFRLVKDGEVVAVAHREQDRVLEDRSFQAWRRCAN